MTNLDAVNKLIERVLAFDDWNKLSGIDKDLILEYRTAAPKLAKALRCAVEALEDHHIFAEGSTEGCRAGKALAEIDRIVKGEK